MRYATDEEFDAYKDGMRDGIALHPCVTEVADAIFEWLTGPPVSKGEDGQPPDTFYKNREEWVVGLDGRLDCYAMAEALVGKFSQMIEERRKRAA